MKRFLIFLLLIGSIFFVANPKADKAKAVSYENATKTRSVYLIETGNGTVLYSKNENERLPIASMTKIMLLNLCFEAVEGKTLGLDETITVSENASGMGGSQVFLEKNGKYLVKDLIKSVIIASANDSSVALAERLYGSEKSCVDAMNAKSKEWKLENTMFSNCTGLTKPTQYSSAKDVAYMLTKLISHKEYFEFSHIWTDEIQHSGGRKTGLTNTNKLVRFYDGCDGGKTGFTQEAGFCLAATAKRGSLRLVAVAINSPDSKTRFNEVSALFNYGFDNFTSKTVVDSSRNLDIETTVSKGKKDKVKVYPENDVFIFSEKNKKENVIIDFKPLNATAPLKKGDEVGELIVYKDNVEFARVKVLSAENVEKQSYFGYIANIGKNW